MSNKINLRKLFQMPFTLKIVVNHMGLLLKVRRLEHLVLVLPLASISVTI